MTRLWDVDSGDLRKLRGHELEVTRLAFDRDSRLLATASLDGSARLWLLQRGEPRRWRLPLNHSHDGVALSPDGADVALASPGGPLLWQPGGEGLRQLASEPGLPRLTFSPDGKRLAACAGGRDLRIHALGGGEPRRLTGHPGPVNDIAFSGDGRTLLAAGDDHLLGIFALDDPPAGPARLLRADEELVRVAVAPSDRTLAATAGRDGTVRLWDLLRGQSRIVQGRHRLDELSFTADGRRLVGGAAGGRAVLVFDVASGRLERTLEEEAAITRLASAEAQLIVIGAEDGSVRVRDLDSGANWSVHEHSGVPVSSLVASLAGAVGAAFGDGWVRWWPGVAPSQPAELSAWLDRATSAVLDGDDRIAGPAQATAGGSAKMPP
jgi:WD40 repeat protein